MMERLILAIGAEEAAAAPLCRRGCAGDAPWRGHDDPLLPFSRLAPGGARHQLRQRDIFPGT